MFVAGCSPVTGWTFENSLFLDDIEMVSAEIFADVRKDGFEFYDFVVEQRSPASQWNCVRATVSSTTTSPITNIH
jgi:hypothetical protein